jgi:hypothetical protein
MSDKALSERRKDQSPIKVYCTVHSDKLLSEMPVLLACPYLPICSVLGRTAV